jgi:hypothetical protein
LEDSRPYCCRSGLTTEGLRTLVAQATGTTSA